MLHNRDKEGRNIADFLVESRHPGPPPVLSLFSLLQESTLVTNVNKDLLGIMLRHMESQEHLSRVYL